MGTEREHKFAVDASFTLPDLAGLAVAEPAATIEQVATYYDTADLRLTRAGASLRYRSDDGWTVKLPAPGGDPTQLTRSEHTFAGSPGSPPTAALELVAARVRTARIAPVARLHTTRRESVLRAGAPTDGIAPGDAIGTLTDDTCTVLDGRTPATFREVELEIAPDAAGDALDDVVTRLRAAGGSDADPRAKVARALGPAAGDPPDVTTYAVGSPATVDAVIRHALSDAVAKLVDADPVVRIGEDIEGVHQARVATRRLRSHLRTFRALLDPDWAWALREELGWLADELGTVRDADVLLDRLRGRIDALDDHDRAAAQPVLDRIRIDQAAARVDLIDALRSPRYLELLDHLVDAAHRPRVVMRVAEDDGEMLRALVRKPVRRLRGAVAQLPDPAPDAALHAVRILAKRARYAAEVMEPAFGRPARALARALTDVQDVLGEHQDAVVAGAWLRATALTLGDPAAVYVAGELGAVERAAAHAARHDWPETWRAASRPALRRWL